MYLKKNPQTQANKNPKTQPKLEYMQMTKIHFLSSYANYYAQTFPVKASAANRKQDFNHLVV